MATIKNIVFDKTGTLTTGKFEISEFNILEGDEKEIKNIIYNIEKHSSHPIAQFNNLTPDIVVDISKQMDIKI